MMAVNPVFIPPSPGFFMAPTGKSNVELESGQDYHFFSLKRLLVLFRLHPLDQGERLSSTSTAPPWSPQASLSSQ